MDLHDWLRVRWPSAGVNKVVYPKGLFRAPQRGHELYLMSGQANRALMCSPA
jgi:hypothetical protein